MKRILITGGAGYIGSHAALMLLEQGYEVLVVDNLCNSTHISLERVSKITRKPLIFLRGDIRDSKFLSNVFKEYTIDAVMHFAGLKAVGESVKEPLEYYGTNVYGTIALCEAMAGAGVYTLIFSSSCTVYGQPKEVPVVESHSIGTPTNPYGRSKYFAEQVLKDLSDSNSRWKIAILRYFNPTGAHESGLIGEDPNGIPNNLIPFITQVIVGRHKRLNIYGNDYPTHDGTGVRDYIHVMDVVEGHLAALTELNNRVGVNIWNLGTGEGYSVLEVVSALEMVSGKTVPYSFSPRRAGDVARIYANSKKAQIELGWIAKRDLKTMARDAWKWQSLNPDGFTKLE